MKYSITEAGKDEIQVIKALLDKVELDNDNIDAENCVTFVMKDNDEVIGCIGLQIYDKNGVICSTAISNKYRNQYLGKELVDYVKSYAKENNIEKIYLKTRVAKFFTECGFSEIVKENLPEELKEVKSLAMTCCEKGKIMICHVDDKINDEERLNYIKESYADKIKKLKAGDTPCCCSSSSESKEEKKGFISKDLYDELPDYISDDVLLMSLGCGNPFYLANIQPGETVLDLGSGGGLDVLLSAKRTGETGYVYGLDMSDEMIATANANKEKLGVTNVSFLKGQIEDIPLSDNSVDLIISNCVINLSLNKAKCFSEMFRVLKPGGRLAISDIVLQKDIDDRYRADMELWASCISGAIKKDEYENYLTNEGFTNVSVETVKTYDADAMDDVKSFEKYTKEEKQELLSSISSCFIRANKRKGCCCCG